MAARDRAVGRQNLGCAQAARSAGRASPQHRRSTLARGFAPEVRLKGSGMHWARANVNPLVALRTVACANRWTEVWPRITARLRADADQRRRSRWRSRHTMPAAPPAEAPPIPATLALMPANNTKPTPAPRGKSVVNGRPTAFHPWKRYDCLPGGRRAHGKPR